MARIPRKLAGIGAADIPNATAFDTYIGPAREITVDQQRGIIALHDGIAPGGYQFRKAEIASYAPFASYDAAIAAPKPPEQSRISAIVNGMLVEWVRDPAGPCLGGGWEPSHDATPYHFGASGDGVADDAPALTNTFIYACSAKRRVSVQAGQYLLKTEVTWDVTSDFEVHLEVGAHLIAADDFPVDAKLIHPIATTGPQRFTWIGGKLDGRNMPPRNVGAPDLLYIAGNNFAQLTITDCWFLCNDDRTTIAGDSCLFIASGSDYTIERNKFQGAYDAGVYISGSQSEIYGKRCRVSHNTFIECTDGVISKRGFEEHIVSDNFMDGVTNGIVIGAIGDVGTTGRKGSITGNVIKRCSRGIELRISNGMTVVGNRIEDYGLTPEGVPTNNHAIRIAGSKYCVVAGNSIYLTGAFAPHANSAAIRIERRTEFSVNHESTDNLISGNVIYGGSKGVQEIDASDRNSIVGNSMEAMTGARISLIGPNSIYEDIHASGKRIRTSFGPSGATPTAGSNTVTENSGVLIESKLTPNDQAYIMLVGDNDNSAVARFSYNHVNDLWSFRAGGSGDIVQIGPDGLRAGVYTATPITATGYVTMRDLSGVQRRFLVG